MYQGDAQSQPNSDPNDMHLLLLSLAKLINQRLNLGIEAAYVGTSDTQPLKPGIFLSNNSDNKVSNLINILIRAGDQRRIKVTATPAGCFIEIGHRNDALAAWGVVNEYIPQQSQHSMTSHSYYMNNSTHQNDQYPRMSSPGYPAGNGSGCYGQPLPPSSSSLYFLQSNGSQNIPQNIPQYPTPYPSTPAYNPYPMKPFPSGYIGDSNFPDMTHQPQNKTTPGYFPVQPINYGSRNPHQQAYTSQVVEGNTVDTRPFLKKIDASYIGIKYSKRYNSQLVYITVEDVNKFMNDYKNKIRKNQFQGGSGLVYVGQDYDTKQITFNEGNFNYFFAYVQKKQVSDYLLVSPFYRVYIASLVQELEASRKNTNSGGGIISKLWSSDNTNDIATLNTLFQNIINADPKDSIQKIIESTCNELERQKLWGRNQLAVDLRTKMDEWFNNDGTCKLNSPAVTQGLRMN